MTKLIPTTRGHFAIVDDEDFTTLSQKKWQYGNGYALHAYHFGFHPTTGKQIVKRIGMHRLIMNPPTGMVVDHINGNKLDNRRCNLRICRQSENMRNLRKKKNKIPENTNCYKGIVWFQNRWVASIGHENKVIYLGRFKCPIEAASAYNTAALKYHGEFAYLNHL